MLKPHSGLSAWVYVSIDSIKVDVTFQFILKRAFCPRREKALSFENQ